METEKSKGSSNGTSFLQDPQKLTLAFGISAGIALMAIVALVIVTVQGGTGSSKTAKTNTNTVAADTNTDTNAADATTYDPVRIASAIGLNMDKFQSCLSNSTFAQRIDSDITAGTTAGVNGTPTTFINGTAVSGALPYTEVKKAIDAALAGTKGTANVPAVTKDDHVEGAKNPKVYLIEYSDFQCPYCKMFTPSLSQALTEYKDTVALVYRHFPLESIHPYARGLAEGSECANDQSKFWEFHDKAFEG